MVEITAAPDEENQFEEVSNMITDADFKTIALGIGLRKEAFDDALSQYPDDGRSVSEWLPTMRKEKAHWFEMAAERVEPALHSLKAQGDLVAEIGEAGAREQLAKHGLTLGQVKPAKKEDAETIKGANNPWSPQWKGDDAARQTRIASIIRGGGTKLAAALAKAAGKTIDGRELRK